ncbi:XrtA/PEP-CTERM system-associated ATPase [Tsuneonella sp. CC-YZS046]|uniref:XrtA/PEP-CTERM system-associated ATPase n=1 Tax=Tsuneonella sp. CC-YZS046 TaxID=3042152 RepID=UPI002D7909B2|nr:XrtA/PEP-CTERM system-associated ATPase [Tsuneonella sp. CC-YZS046]WRO67858.1 XrtA/PEP-CTERM system-associated ATPase [Tsuneonella sp. CC-YZS046]
MYDDFYGLSGRPFQLTPDPAFYFESISHRKALSYLSYGLAQGEGFIVITGEVGAGKSTLVAHLTSTVDPERLTVGQVVTSKLDGEEIIHVVAQCFGLDIEGHDKASALGAIEGFLHDEARAGRRCLLVVDELQNMAISALEELRMLSNFQLGSHPLLQTLLLGQPEFRTTLQTHPNLEQLRQRVIATHHLDAMEASEVEPYIKHRLSRVGWRDNPSFDQGVFAELYEATRGIPRRINQLANRLLLLGAVEQRSRIDEMMLRTVLAEIADDNISNAVAPAAQTPGEAAKPEKPEAGSTGQPAALAFDPKLVEAMLSARDARIAELQQAVVELSHGLEDGLSAAHAPAIEALAERLGQIEAKMAEQERAIRHTLTMLIEWIESDASRSMAA